MIARAKFPKPKVTPKQWQKFLVMLPLIARAARIAFKDKDPEAREELTADVVARAYLMFARLVETSREDLAYPTPLATFGIRQTKDGRKVGMKLNVRDISSKHCQQRKGIFLERLDRFDRQEGQWLEVLIEDPRSGPAETAAARIDIADWFGLLPPRDRKIAGALAVGGTTSEVAHEFRLSPARISQKRQEYRENWNRFQGEEAGRQDDALMGAAIA
jgi:hypothetical protein